MSSVRFILRDLGVNRLRSVWARGVNVGNIVRRYRKDRSVRDVIVCFRQAFFRPRRAFLLSGAAACKASADDSKLTSCDQNITDKELEDLLSELDSVDELTRTLYCSTCKKRLVIDKKQPGVNYCSCKDTHPPETTADGWEPYTEAEDVIIWKKEYKPGQGLYAYKVYGRYKEVTASHFAAVQVDNGYRRAWDAAVAALTVVETSATVPDQAILHWEVLWPRLFANRDYVYVRRHKEYDIKTESQRAPIEVTPTPTPTTPTEDRPSVHSNAKRKAIEEYSKVGERVNVDNKVYVIVSKSCEHPKVPQTRNAIRVSEYWSHMVVRTLDGTQNPGMEFVLTYYDEPIVGGLPGGVSAWATGRAAPAYLDKMRLAAKEYIAYRQTHDPDQSDIVPSLPEKVAFEDTKVVSRVNEQDMESSKEGPEIETDEANTRLERQDQATQTEDRIEISLNLVDVKQSADTKDKAIGTTDHTESHKDSLKSDDGPDDNENEDDETKTRWYRYLYPFYYFV